MSFSPLLLFIFLFFIVIGKTLFSKRVFPYPFPKTFDLKVFM